MAGHLAVVGEHECRLQGIAVAQRVPRIHDGVMAHADVDTGREQLLHARVAAPDRVRVETALQHRVVQGVGHHMHSRPLQVVDEPVRVCRVVRVHRRGVTGGDAPTHAEPDRLGRHHLNEARVVVVGLVAVDVDAQPFLGGERHRELDRPLAVFACQLVMRYRADHVDAHVDCPLHQVLAAVERHDPLLRERDQLHRHLVADLLAQLHQGANGAQLRIADVNVAAHELDPVGELPPEHRAHAALDVVDGQLLDALGPDRDALKERAGLVLAGLADREHRIEVDVRLDERRRYQRTAQVDDLARLRFGLGDAAVSYPDLPRGGLSRQPGALQEQIEHRREANRDLNSPDKGVPAKSKISWVEKSG